MTCFTKQSFQAYILHEESISLGCHKKYLSLEDSKQTMSKQKNPEFFQAKFRIFVAE